ncbi:MAG: LPS export ABC transporter periplasmic protein LptC [Candidatus Competibacterales bacterium]|nr:LPS export ABC transporter periplasmic protein LptC [Candidatus Competibacterales bacterium]
MRSALLSYVLLGTLAGLSLWLLLSLQATLRTDAEPGAEGPALILDWFVATRMDGNGRRQYTLSAPHLVRLPDERGTEVEAPRFALYRHDGTQDWAIEAEQGWLDADHDIALLKREVVARRVATGNHPPLTIQTRDLVYRPPHNTLASDAPVRLETPTGWQRGVGLRVDLEAQRLVLLREVTGEYAPPAP